MTFKVLFLHTCRFHVQKITYKRKRFYIELRSENGSRQPNTVGFHMDSYDGCKQLWKSCIEYNAFFRWGYKTVAVLTGSGMVELSLTRVPFSWQLGKGPCYNMCKTIWYSAWWRAYHLWANNNKMDDIYMYLFVPPPTQSIFWCACPAPCPHIQLPTSSHVLEGADGARTTGKCTGEIQEPQGFQVGSHATSNYIRVCNNM